MDIALLYKKVEGTLTEAEAELVEQWLADDARHRRYMEALEQYLRGEKEYTLTAEQLAACKEHFTRRLKRRKMQRAVRRYVRYATGVAAIFVVGILLVRHLDNSGDSSAILPEKSENTVIRTAEAKDGQTSATKSSNRRITLITDEGESVTYDSLNTWSRANGATMDAATGLLSYAPDEGKTAAKREEEKYNEMVVGKGAEFSVVLDDGTRVWLNADSRLKYPTNFRGRERKVWLKGEAYFDVKTDSCRPFTVVAGAADISVYGTEFNIHAREEREVHTTLVEGCVAVSLSGDTCRTRLNPGWTAEVNADEGSISLKEEPVELHIGWKQGKYYFEETPLRELFAELALWYDVEVTFDDESLAGERFSGCLSRRTSLDATLRILQETTYLTVKRRGKQLIIGN